MTLFAVAKTVCQRIHTFIVSNTDLFATEKRATFYPYPCSHVTTRPWQLAAGDSCTLVDTVSARLLTSAPRVSVHGAGSHDLRVAPPPPPPALSHSHTSCWLQYQFGQCQTTKVRVFKPSVAKCLMLDLIEVLEGDFQTGASPPPFEHP